MALNYPRKLDLALTPTPLQLLERASSQWGRGHRLWIKRDDLTGCALSGNKVRKLEFIAAHAIDNGYDTLITCGGLQSNHARATALVGAQLGLDVHLLLRGEEPLEREALDHEPGIEGGLDHESSEADEAEVGWADDLSVGPSEEELRAERGKDEPGHFEPPADPDPEGGAPIEDSPADPERP